MPPQASLHYASLLLGGVRYDTLEFSAAGLSLARSAVEASELDALERGDECAAALCLGGDGWEEVYSVVLRLATRAPAHIGLAFVTLPPAARRLLVWDSGGGEEGEPGSVGSSPWGGRPAPFAFARLVERGAPSRRLVLPASAAVFAVTQTRNKANGPRPKAAAMRALPLRVFPGGAVAGESGGLPASALLVYGTTLILALMVFWAVVVG